MEAAAKIERVSFGLFEVDLLAGELWKAGYRVRLSGQPFKVLVVLLERSGEVVTREELQTQVWTQTINLDFDRAISGAINKVREALGDSAESPRYIETLTKRGYRFIAPVSVINVTHGESFRGQAPALIDPSEGDRERSSMQKTSSQTKSLIPEQVSAEHKPSALEWQISSVPSQSVHLSNPRRPSREWILGLLCALLLIGIVTQWVMNKPQELPPLRIIQVTHSIPVSLGPPNAESFLTLAQDGDRIFSPVLINGRSHLSVITASTGERQAIPLPDGISFSTLTDISRDGTRLLLRNNRSSESEQPLWIVPSSGGSGQRVGNILAHDATWMPDGTTILYASENDLSLFRQADAKSAVFAKLKGRAFWLRWSPDGSLLRFTLMDPVMHTSTLWEIGIHDKEPHPVPGLESVGLSTCCGIWTSDGKVYVFQAAENLWAITGSSARSRLRQLTNGPLRFLSPVAGRSGSQVYFVGLEQPTGLQRLATRHNEFEAAPAFLADANRIEYSRDGKWVAWIDLHERLWRANAIDGSDKIRVTSDALEVFLAHWSPDGSRLVIMARESGGVWQTYLVGAEGGRPEPVMHEGRNAADPSWSADGKSLVYGREPDLMGKEAGPRNLQMLNLQTHATETLPNSDGLFSPRWSPDGRWIVALSVDQKHLMLYDLNLQRWNELLTTSAADPVWSADSRSIYIHAFTEDREPILRVSVPEGQVQVVADLGSFHDRDYANYFFGGLTPEGEPLVQPRIGTGSIYSLNLNP